MLISARNLDNSNVRILYKVLSAHSDGMMLIERLDSKTPVRKLINKDEFHELFFLENSHYQCDYQRNGKTVIRWIKRPSLAKITLAERGPHP
jgi:hypothetical protein